MFHSFEEFYSVSGFLAVTCFFAVLFYVAQYVKKTRKLPPGPMGLPVLGYLPFLTDMPHLEMMKLASKYGDIFSMRLGNTFAVVLNNYALIREAFSKPEFLGRPPNTVFHLVKGLESPFLSSGRVWQEQRRFAMQTMRDLGLGKSSMEKHILEEIHHFLEGIRKSDGMPIWIVRNLMPSMSNNICSLVFGKRYKYDDPQRIFLDEILQFVTRTSQMLTPHIFFPWLRYMPFGNKIFKIGILSDKVEELKDFMRKRIDQHENTLDPDNVRDLIDGYLVEMKTRLEKDHHTVFSYNMLVGMVINLFGAGSETVHTTVTWCVYTVAVYQDVQRRIQAEIDDVVGKERMPSWQDQKQMPYTMAVLTEIQRWKTVAPLGLPRYILEDTELQGYHIPKGTTIIQNIWAAHHDPNDWEHPDEFIPDRFLSKDGKSVIKAAGYIPFSTGKRSCPGEALALIEVFLYFTSVLQRFTVEIPEGDTVNFEGTFGVTYRLKQHNLCFKPRH